MQADEHVTDLLPAYALGNLEQLEELLVAEHLAACAQCQEELRAYQIVIDDLPLAAANINPPAELKKGLMARARAASAPKENTSLSWQEQLNTLLKGIMPAWGLASLVIVLVLGASNLLLWQRLNLIEHGQPSQLLTITLRGTENMPAAMGTLVLSNDGEYGTLVVDGMDSLDTGQEYQLWLIRGEQRTSGGVFSVDAEGYGYLAISAPDALDSYTSFGVTIEPTGGSPGPTGEKVLGGQF